MQSINKVMIGSHISIRLTWTEYYGSFSDILLLKLERRVKDKHLMPDHINEVLLNENLCYTLATLCGRRQRH